MFYLSTYWNSASESHGQQGQQSHLASGINISASKSSIRRFVITEKAPTRAFSWLKAPTSAFTFKTLLRHYSKRALTPRSLNVKLGPRLKKGGYKTCAKAESPLLPPAARITLYTHRASRWTRAAYLRNKICISFT